MLVRKRVVVGGGCVDGVGEEKGGGGRWEGVVLMMIVRKRVVVGGGYGRRVVLMLVRKRVVVCGGCVDGVGEEKGGSGYGGGGGLC